VSPAAAPPLSVVIPSRNTRALTLACLASLASAARHRPALSDLDVVLVDDAGADGTAEAVAGLHPGVRLLRLASQAGFSRAANLGMAAARGDVLLLLNSDTEVEGDGLADLLAAFAAEPRLGIAGASLRFADGAPQWSGGGEPGPAWLFALASGLPHLAARLPLYRRLKPPSGAAGPRPAGRLRQVAWVTGAAMAIRRAAWAAAGPFDERFRFYGQDLDLCLRARDAGWEVAVLADLRVVHHQGSTIGREGGRRLGGGERRGAQHVELLWSDLVRCAAKRGGARAARRAAAALRAGATLRLLGRGLAMPLVPAARRADFRAETAELAAALAALAGGGAGTSETW
jgi:GT2 family glycosyltransferase